MIFPEQIIVYGSVLITIAVSLLVVALAALYVSLLQKYKALLEEKKSFKAQTDAELEKTLDEARQKAHQIIEEGNVRASKIVGDAGVFNEQLRGEMLRELGKVSAVFTKDYQGTLEAAKNEALKTISNISKGIGSEASRQIDAMRQTLQQEIARAQATTKEAIDAAYQKVEEEIKLYRVSRLQRVDAQIYEIIRQVSEDVIGKALDPQEHEELVIKSLEEAKRQGVL